MTKRTLVIVVAALLLLLAVGTVVTFALWSGGGAEPEIVTESEPARR
jgi:hypothetical protein